MRRPWTVAAWAVTLLTLALPTVSRSQDYVADSCRPVVAITLQGESFSSCVPPESFRLTVSNASTLQVGASRLTSSPEPPRMGHLELARPVDGLSPVLDQAYWNNLPIEELLLDLRSAGAAAIRLSPQRLTIRIRGARVLSITRESDQVAMHPGISVESLVLQIDGSLSADYSEEQPEGRVEMPSLDLVPAGGHSTETAVPEVFPDPPALRSLPAGRILFGGFSGSLTASIDRQYVGWSLVSAAKTVLNGHTWFMKPIDLATLPLLHAAAVGGPVGDVRIVLRHAVGGDPSVTEVIQDITPLFSGGGPSIGHYTLAAVDVPSWLAGGGSVPYEIVGLADSRTASAVWLVRKDGTMTEAPAPRF